MDIATTNRSSHAPSSLTRPTEVDDPEGAGARGEDRAASLDALVVLPGSLTLEQARSALAHASSTLYRLWMDTLLDPDTDDETRERLALAARLSRQAQLAVDRDALW